MVDLSEPQTYWLNVTNIALGIAVVVCWLVVVVEVAWALGRQLVRRES